jgi:hypothetical protein
MSEREVWALLESGGVWRFGQCEVVLDPDTRELVVFYLGGSPGHDDPDGRRPRPTPRRPAGRSLRLTLAAAA